MLQEEQKVLIRLEDLRRLLHETAREKGISHPDVLSVSQLLDKTLNEYYILILRK